MRSDRHENEMARQDDAPPMLEHPLVPAGEPVLVNTAPDLGRLIDDLRSAGCFGYDSEFIGEHSYYPQLCVIQVGTDERIWLIDPLARLDLTPFWELLADASVQKIVHCGTQDLEPVLRHLNRPPQNTFDTQIAAAFMGMDYPCGLTRLVNDLQGAELGRELKFTQWDRRPLSQVQLCYAANDVRYLPLLLQTMTRELSAVGNAASALAECDHLSTAAHYRLDTDSQALRVRSAETLDATQHAVLRALIGWREGAAREQDTPPRSLVKDKVLVSLSRAPARSTEALRTVGGLPRPVKRDYGQAIVDAIRAALDQPIDETRSRVFNPYSHRRRIESCWSAVQERCVDNTIAPAVVTNKKQIGLLIRSAAENVVCPDGPTARLLTGWRWELLRPVLEPLGIHGT